MNENKVKVWLERDKNGGLWLYPSIPLRDEDGGILFCNGSITQLDSSSFPSVKWGDAEPTEAYIALANEPQPKKEIDWEQRRYEIAKEMMTVLYRHAMEAQKHGQNVKRKDTADYAVIFADMLIQKLKEQGK